MEQTEVCCRFTNKSVVHIVAEAIEHLLGLTVDRVAFDREGDTLYVRGDFSPEDVPQFTRYLAGIGVSWKCKQTLAFKFGEQNCLTFLVDLLKNGYPKVAVKGLRLSSYNVECPGDDESMGDEQAHAVAEYLCGWGIDAEVLE
jgi:hypothetical protein